MSKPVDVVAVLRRMLYQAGCGRLGQDGASVEAHRQQAAEDRAAIDAVAELIVVAEFGKQLIEKEVIRARLSQQDGFLAWVEMLNAALAACKPATGAEK